MHDARCLDATLVTAAQQGDETASSELIRRYRALVRGRARHYFLAGADRDDVTQEGLLGLFKAIRDFDPQREASFHSFAELCVTRQIISAVKSATRRKHTPLNGYVSLTSSAPDDEGGERLLSDIIAARDLCDPAEIVISAWRAATIRDGVLGALSPFERDVLRLYVSGCSYQRIAEVLGRHTKAVDNALQRIKRKLETQITRCEGNC
jgi:RNA polymerase sporulation-specific sigma factor